MVSRKNYEYINEYRKCLGSKEYQKLIGKSRVPTAVLRYPILKFIYVYSISLVLLFILAKKVILTFREKRTVGNKIIGINELFLATGKGGMLQKLLKHADIDVSKGYWLCKRNEYQDDISKERQISSLSFLSNRNIIWAALDSIRCFGIIVRRKGYSFALEANGAYDWFIYYWTLQNISKDVTLYFCQTYDPIIVCIGRAPQRNKIHLQHGTLLLRTNANNIDYPILQYMEAYKCWTVNSPYKLSSVMKAYAFTEREYEAECLSIFKNRPSPVFIGYNLQKKDLVYVPGKRIKVLIIAFYRAFGDKIAEIIKRLYCYDVDILLKVHPQDNPSLFADAASNYGVKVFTGCDFPAADVILSYESTLALEYEALGSKIIYFHIDDVSVVITKLEEELRARNTTDNQIMS